MWDSLLHRHTAGALGSGTPAVHYHVALGSGQWDSFWCTVTLLGNSGQWDSLWAMQLLVLSVALLHLVSLEATVAAGGACLGHFLTEDVYLQLLIIEGWTHTTGGGRGYCVFGDSMDLGGFIRPSRVR